MRLFAASTASRSAVYNTCHEIARAVPPPPPPLPRLLPRLSAVPVIDSSAGHRENLRPRNGPCAYPAAFVLLDHNPRAFTERAPDVINAVRAIMHVRRARAVTTFHAEFRDGGISVGARGSRSETPPSIIAFARYSPFS